MCYATLIERHMDKIKKIYGIETDQEAWDLFNIRQAQAPNLFKYGERTDHYHYAPVVHLVHGKLIVEPMRYGIHTRDHSGPKNIKFDYNARRDNIHAGFWEDGFRVNHGFVILRGFFESVTARQLIEGGTIPESEVLRVFDAMKAARYRRWEGKAKKVKPTKAEQTPPMDRSIEIMFRPMDDEDMLVPTIFTSRELNDGELDYGFAIMTDPATPEIWKTGHDRRPIMLGLEVMNEWIRPEHKTSRQLDDILGRASHRPQICKISIRYDEDLAEFRKSASVS